MPDYSITVTTVDYKRRGYGPHMGIGRFGYSFNFKEPLKDIFEDCVRGGGWADMYGPFIEILIIKQPVVGEVNYYIRVPYDVMRQHLAGEVCEADVIATCSITKSEYLECMKAQENFMKSEFYK
jgi:hypothetical protein